jgi:hypothetical protein
MAAATTSVNGYLTSTDWNTFNNKTSNTGTVTSVGGTGTVNGISLSGTVTTSGNLTLGGTLSGVSLTTQVSGTLPVANGGTGLTSVTSARVPYGNGSSALNTSANLTFNGETLTVNSVAVSARFTESNGGTANTAVGNSALSTSVSGGDIYNQNTAVGYFALKNNTTGYENTAVGAFALEDLTTAYNNTAVGSGALANNISSNSNTAIGRFAMYNVKSGGNCAIGDNGLNNPFADITGGNNIGIGNNTGQTLTSGSNNIIIHTGGAAAFAITTQSNRIAMGNTAVTNAYVQVAWTVVSDARDKMNFTPIPHGLEFVNQLNPVSYQFIEDREAEIPVPYGPFRYGFKAQDILALEGNNPIIIDAEDPEKLRYNGEALVPVLVNAVKELSAKVDQLQAEIAALKA